MNSKFTRLIGVLLVVAAAFGVLFSFLGIIEVWRIKPTVVSGLSYELDIVDATVANTVAGLDTVSNTLSTLSGNVEALQNTTVGLSQSIHGAEPMMDTLVKLLGQDLPNTITTTQTSLNSAASSAQLIDNVMGSITSLPLLGLNKYAPAVPLHTALSNVSGSLGKITPALTDLQANLTTAKGNLTNIETEVTRMGGNIEEIKTNMDNAYQIITQYQQESSTLLAQIELARRELPVWINSLAWFLTILLVWLAITQIGLFLRGWEMLERKF